MTIDQPVEEYAQKNFNLPYPPHSTHILYKIMTKGCAMEKIRIGIVGYGNLGKGAECALRQTPDMELAAVYTRRNPEKVKSRFEDTKILPVSALEREGEAGGTAENGLDVLLLCGGSASDLPVQTPKYAEKFCVVDSFDNHAQIPAHFARVDAAAKKGNRLALISAGWDPGLFSVNRLVSQAALPFGETYTFWGRGVSQGHSDAIRRIPGVADARQYTIPVESALEAVRRGDNPQLSVRDKHIRECFVAAEPGADLCAIEEAIVKMPGYFAEYETFVNFVSKKELQEHHSCMPHGGFVIRSGKTGARRNHSQTYEFRLKLSSNPEFTASVLLAYGRAAFRLAKKGETGCKTVLDIAPGLLLPQDEKTQRKELL